MKTSAKLVPEPTPALYVEMTMPVEAAQDLLNLLQSLRNRKGDLGGDDVYVSRVLKDLGYEIDEEGYFTQALKNSRLFSAGGHVFSVESMLRKVIPKA